MFGRTSKSVQISVLCPQPVGVNARGSLDNFFEIAVICLVEIRSVTSAIRHLGVKKERRKKEEKTTAVKYKPFGIAIPCGIIIEDGLRRSNIDMNALAILTACCDLDL